MDTNLFSIVIPCRNEEKLIGYTLQSILMQTAVNHNTPVIIADAGSTDNTLNIIEGFKQQMFIKVVKGGLPPVGRNNGARCCNTRFILFMDADVKLGGPDVLQTIIDMADKGNLDLVVPKIKIDNAGWRDKIFEKLYFFTAKTKILGAFGTGMFICITNEAFKQLGPFNESLPLGDDWELTHKIKPERFGVSDIPVYTSNRRFNSNGYVSTFYMWASVALSKTYRDKGHPEYFYDYYAEEHDNNRRAFQ